MSNELVDKPLTKRDLSRLSKLETTIQKGMQTFFEVGAALKEIRDRKLYRSDFKRFEDYCQERWGFNGDYARKNIAAVEVRSELSQGNTIVSLLPANEAQCRPLTKLEDGDRQDAWQTVIERAEEEAEKTGNEPQITAKLVQQVVNEMTTGGIVYDVTDAALDLREVIRKRVTKYKGNEREVMVTTLEHIVREEVKSW